MDYDAAFPFPEVIVVKIQEVDDSCHGFWTVFSEFDTVLFLQNCQNIAMYSELEGTSDLEFTLADRGEEVRFWGYDVAVYLEFLTSAGDREVRVFSG